MALTPDRVVVYVEKNQVRALANAVAEAQAIEGMIDRALESLDTTIHGGFIVTINPGGAELSAQVREFVIAAYRAVGWRWMKFEPIYEEEHGHGLMSSGAHSFGPSRPIKGYRVTLKTNETT